MGVKRNQGGVVVWPTLGGSHAIEVRRGVSGAVQSPPDHRGRTVVDEAVGRASVVCADINNVLQSRRTGESIQAQPGIAGGLSANHAPPGAVATEICRTAAIIRHSGVRRSVGE